MRFPGLPPVLLLDLDDTILRFSAGQPNFWQLAVQQHLPEHAEHRRLVTRIEAVSREFWEPAERAFWGRQNMLEARRQITLAALAEEGVSRELCQRIADDMTEWKESSVRPFDGALETLQLLRERGHRLALLTNGSREFQRRKLERYALEPLFELVLIEGELGYGKPDARVFRAALAHFAIEPHQAWMVGDNLDADIAGAREVGILGVWHDAHGTGLPALPSVVPERVIRRLSELIGEQAHARSR
ncbi:MAG TPA: HAD family hydrolase [Polyangiaceae bacterium]|nr:HAD family hydrolase [Polyangiaceae bacterium]